MWTRSTRRPLRAPVLSACALALILVAGCLWPARPTAAEGTTEYAVKAAFLLNFAKFATWPAGAAPPGADLTICVLGTDPFGPYLDALAGKDVHGRTVRVRRVSLADAPSCRVVFLSGSETDRLETVLDALADRPVLTVGDTPGFAERGVMINLVLRDRKVRFRINHAASRDAGISLSAHLLRLAEIVDGEVPS